MNVLLIGHEGYLGRGLFSYLVRRGHRVVGCDKKEDLFNLDAGILARENIEMLINLSVVAVRAGKTFQADTPCDTVNVEGARHVGRILKGTGITWIQMSTREIFGPVYTSKDVVRTKNGLRPKRLIDEEQPYAPINFYGKSKLMAEFISESHPESAVIRLTTCYTDYDHPTASNWILALVRSAVEGKPVNLTRGGRQFRDPLHVDDLGHLMELIHVKKAFGEKFHAGGGKKNLISLKEFVKIADPKVKILNAPGGDYGFAFDNSKAKKLTGWEPKILVREYIPVIAANIRNSVSLPPEMGLERKAFQLGPVFS
jgi:nucleoside-diphosphate-sugar epimerase